MTGKTLSEKKKAFAREYIIDRCAAAAAERAGYSKKTARTQGSRLKKDPLVQQEISRLEDPILEKCGSKAEDVINEIKLLSHSSMDDFIDIDSETGCVTPKPWELIPKEKRRLIKIVREKRVVKLGSDKKETLVEITTDYVLWDKVKPLEMLGKYHKLFTDKVDYTSGGQPLVNGDGIDRSNLSSEEIREIIRMKNKTKKAG